jgi:hypothetical protein
MRKVLLLLLITTAINVFGQDTTIALSRFEQFNLQSGGVLKNEIQELGTINLVTFDLVKSTDLSSGQKFDAVKFYVGDKNRFEIVNNSAFYISADNLDTVISVLKFFKAEMEKQVPTKNVHYTFTTNDNIRFTFYYDISYSGNWYFAINRLYQQPYIIGSPFQISLIKKRIPELIYLLERGREATL